MPVYAQSGEYVGSVGLHSMAGTGLAGPCIMTSFSPSVISLRINEARSEGSKEVSSHGRLADDETLPRSVARVTNMQANMIRIFLRQTSVTDRRTAAYSLGPGPYRTTVRSVDQNLVTNHQLQSASDSCGQVR